MQIPCLAAASSPIGATTHRCHLPRKKVPFIPKLLKDSFLILVSHRNAPHRTAMRRIARLPTLHLTPPTPSPRLPLSPRALLLSRPASLPPPAFFPTLLALLPSLFFSCPPAHVARPFFRPFFSSLYSSFSPNNFFCSKVAADADQEIGSLSLSSAEVKIDDDIAKGFGFHVCCRQSGQASADCRLSG